ncbi:MAG TPA: D-alanyl-D-alanine carboxypeptidase/D-alanyl-D-alanine-endopeptidase [Candidatus Acidoferrales bacterium]|nr:D-alanyl-D-alanine carboxypeptidase/D-alanyl-D-alanine-endopeptidase [Candidatus Acidoferrales bacterium]
MRAATRVVFGVCAFCLVAAQTHAADMSSTGTLPKPGVSGAAWSPSDIARLASDIDGMLAGEPALRGAHVGLYAVDSRSGAVLYARNVDDDFTPASNVKLVTGSTALARLGGDFRLRTTLFATAPIQSGVVDGDLVLRGGGDPLLSASDLDAAAASLAAQGVRDIRGGIVTDASYFDDQSYGPGWAWDDLAYDYGAPISALSLEDNAVQLTVYAANYPGTPASIVAAPVSGAYTVRNSVTTGAQGARDTVALTREADGSLLLSGVIPLGAAPDHFAGAVPDPPAFAADVLRDALAGRGVVVERGTAPGLAPANGVVLWQHDSEPLRLLLADFWYPSDNLVGEALLKLLGIARTGVPGTDAGGLDLEMEFLREAGVDTRTVALVDGSGLSRYDQLTPRALVDVLQYDWNSSDRDVVLNALPVAGVRGTLKDAFANSAASGRIFAKTGGMLNVTNLSGYIATMHHGAVTFSFLIDDALGDDGAISALRARVLSRFVRD